MRVVISPIEHYKYRAIFKDGTHTDFGQRGYTDYTITGDVQQRRRYRQRHLKDLDTHDPRRAGWLSLGILWGPSTSLRENIETYQSRYPFL